MLRDEIKEARKRYNEMRRKHATSMHRSLDLAMDVYQLLVDSEPVEELHEGGILDMDLVYNLVRERSGAILEDEDKLIIFASIQRAMFKDGFSTCSAWGLAHVLEHIIWREEH